MLKSECKVGMQVYFGRENGQKTLAKVIKTNPTKALVETLESRGNGRGSKVGSSWRVPYSCLEIASQIWQERPIVQTAPKSAPKPALEYNQFDFVNNAILQAIVLIYGELEPETLTCDGEVPPSVWRRTAAQLNQKLDHLFKALGKTVSATEAYNWERSKNKKAS